MTRVVSCRIIQFMESASTHDLADHAVAQASASAAIPWSDRTAENVEVDGQQWAVIVDWAMGTDGTRVPASVTLSSLGAVLTERPADVEPRAVTRGVINRIPWASVIRQSQASVAALPGDWSGFRGASQPTAAQQAAQSRPSASTHDIHRRVADHYRRLGGESNPTIKQDVTTQLQLEGVTPMRRGKRPGDDKPELSVTTVGRWIREARKSGLLSPSSRRPSRGTSKTSGHDPGGNDTEVTQQGRQL
jgi:hypothetical protein